MPRLKRRVPSYRHHKRSKQAVVTLDGRDFYLGPYDSEASRREYDRLVGIWQANGRRLPAVSAEHAETSINEIILAFMRHAKTHYRRPDGTVTNEITAYRSALRIVKCLYGRETAVTFGPRALIVVREEMVRKGWVRTNINKQVSRIRSLFKWAASQQLVPATVYQSLQTVAGLQAGRTQAKESEPVQPVPEQHVIAIRPHVSRQVWTVAQLQQLTGARAGEIVRMRPVDLDTTGEIWVYSPPQHKTRHHGHAASDPSRASGPGSRSALPRRTAA